jgi:hypothetical protein
VGGGIAGHEVVTAEALAYRSGACHVHDKVSAATRLQIDIAAASFVRQKHSIRGDNTALGLHKACARPSETAIIARSRRERASEIRAEEGGVGEQDWGVWPPYGAIVAAIEHSEIVYKNRIIYSMICVVPILWACALHGWADELCAPRELGIACICCCG